MEVYLVSLSCLSIAAFLDYLIGDPVGCLHPVQVMGWVVTVSTRLWWRLWAVWQLQSKGFLTSESQQLQPKFLEQKFLERLIGIYLVIMLLGVSGGVVAWGIQMSTSMHLGFGLILSTVTLASCLAGRSLRDAAVAVLAPVKTEDMDMARQVLSRYVGRDTAELSAPDIYRAVLETVTENATDGVMAPLFYGWLGLMVWGLPGVGLAIAYKALSTLDSMIGYLTPPYTHIGWASAKLEDFVTWLPCRLHVLTLALLSGRPGEVLAICRRDAPQDPSPNSGWSESVYAAILGVQMGGENSYQGVIKSKPLLGDDRQPITEAVILQALDLTRYAVLLWLVIGGFCIIASQYHTILPNS